MSSLDYNPSDAHLDDEEVLSFNLSIGQSQVDQVLGVASWLWDYCRYQWAPQGICGYEDAFSAVGRLIAIAATIESTHPEDLSYALGLPVIFVRLALHLLDQAGWKEFLLGSLVGQIRKGPDVLAIKDLIDEFLITGDFATPDSVDMLKVIGPAVKGMGRTPFGVELPLLTFSDQQDWLDSLP